MIDDSRIIKNKLYTLKGKILRFIKDSKKPIYSGDIQTEFGIDKGTSSTYLKALENLNLIYRKREGRLKAIYLTDDGDSVFE